MRAMLLDAAQQPLRPVDLPTPKPATGQVLIAVRTCAICRTDLHVVDGELPRPKRPLVPGHQIVGTIVQLGAGVHGFVVGDRVGVPWLGFTCGVCGYCTSGRENLCDEARFTGYQLDGGYAEQCVADARFCFHLPSGYDDVQAAPLLCAGAIGYRSLKLAGDGARIGLYGFGAAAHLIAQIARSQGREVFAFTRPGDDEGQRFARELGVTWAGGSNEAPPVSLDAALVFAPVGALVPAALLVVHKAGVVVCAGIHMSDIPQFPYRWLWGERMIRSVANLTREDAKDLLALAARVPLRVEATRYPLTQANQALASLRAGQLHGSGVLEISPSP